MMVCNGSDRDDALERLPEDGEFNCDCDRERTICRAAADVDNEVEEMEGVNDTGMKENEEEGVETSHTDTKRR